MEEARSFATSKTAHNTTQTQDSEDHNLKNLHHENIQYYYYTYFPTLLAARLEHQQDDTKEIYSLNNGTVVWWMLGFLREEEIEGTQINLV
jgi:hypothetical protein